MTTSPEITVLDTQFLGENSVIASYLIESDDGLILIETGPETVFEHLKSTIAKHGYHWQEVRHVLLTHIHFDHAGGAWKFADNGAKIYVHPIGLPHLNDPEKLWNSAKRIYKDDMERLWGKMEPIAKKHLIAAEDGDQLSIGGVDIEVHYTPGHAIHHNAYQIGTTIFTGDVAGVKINNGPVQPPCPPPDIDIEGWKDSIQKLRNQGPDKLYLAHYGLVDHPDRHLKALENSLDDWKAWMKPYYDQRVSPKEITPKFVEYTNDQLKKAGVGKSDIERYNKGNPTYMSVSGLLRYWKLKEQGRL